MLLREAGNDYGWKLNFGGIALMWRGGCIIRSAFLGKIKEAFDKGESLNDVTLKKRFVVLGQCFSTGVRAAKS
jgi:6-phosphogluconate dehydrogenase